MNSLPAAAQVVIYVGAFLVVLLMLGFQLKTKFKASDTIYEGVLTELRRVNDRVKTLTEQLDTERAERHSETTSLRTQINTLSSELSQTKTRLATVQDQVRRMGQEPIA